MNSNTLRSGVSLILIAFASAFASQVAVVLADVRFDERINHVAPIFGVSIAVGLIFGYRWLLAVLIGATIPRFFPEPNVVAMLREPVAALVAAVFARRVFEYFQINSGLERARDAFSFVLWGAGAATLVGAFVQSVFLCSSDTGVGWHEFRGSW